MIRGATLNSTMVNRSTYSNRNVPGAANRPSRSSESTALVVGPKLFGQETSNIVKEKANTQENTLKAFQQQIEARDAKLKVLKHLKEDVAALNESVCHLTQTNDSLKQKAQDVFQHMIAIRISGDNVDLDVTPVALPQRIEVNVVKLASHDNVEASKGFSSHTEALNLQGSFTLQGQEIILNPSMTLQNIVDTINALKATTGVSAVLMPANEAYWLSFSSQATGQPIELDYSGIELGDKASCFPPTSEATIESLRAEIQLRGVKDLIVSSSNTINIGESLKFTLKAEGKAVLEVKQDLSIIVEKIENFIEAYNKVIAAKPSELKSLKQTLDRSLQVIFSGPKGGASSDMQSLEDMGLIKDKETGNLKIIAPKFKEVLNGDIERLKRAFGLGITTSDVRLSVSERPAVIPASLLGKDLIITKTADNTATIQLEENTYDLEVKGNLLQGKPNTLFQNFIFKYTAETHTPSTLRLSQGIAEQLKEALTLFLEPRNGSFTQEENQINRDKARINQDESRYTVISNKEIETGKNRLGDLQTGDIKNKMFKAYNSRRR